MQKYRRVTYEDRCHICSYLQVKIGVVEISRRLGFHKTTIYREIKRNKRGQDYEAGLATRKAYDRFKRCRRKKIIDYKLKEKIIKYMSKGWSPQQISGRFKKEGQELVSTQTIYRSILKHRYEYKLLRMFNKRGGGRRVEQKAKLEGKLMIQDRPSIVEQRKRLGDWERDGMYGANRNQLLVMLDRKSRLVKIANMGTGTSEKVEGLTQEILKGVGKKVYTITNDNGTEFRKGMTSKYKVYYCKPLRPDQRGSVENAIGLLRQYIKRKTDLTQLTPKDLLVLEDRLNHRPRKCLNFRTPHEVFYQHNVALVV